MNEHYEPINGKKANRIFNVLQFNLSVSEAERKEFVEDLIKINEAIMINVNVNCPSRVFKLFAKLLNKPFQVWYYPLDNISCFSIEGLDREDFKHLIETRIKKILLM